MSPSAATAQPRLTYFYFPMACSAHSSGEQYPARHEPTDLVVTMTRHVPSGERPEGISLRNVAFSQVRANGQQLRPLAIRESAMPAGSPVVKRKPSFGNETA